MVFLNVCPRCESELKKTASSAFCKCGWVESRSQIIAERKTEKKAIISFMVFCSVVLLGFGHLLNWGSYAFSIPFLKAAQISGTASKSTLETIITACMVNGKWSCVEQAHIDLYRATNDPEVVAKLANIQSKLAKDAQALQTYQSYVQVGGKNPEALLSFAKLLEKSGNAEQAIIQYEASAAAQTERLPVRAMTGLVRLLISQRRLQEAFDKIQKFHDSAENAGGYFVAEMEQLESALKAPKKMAAR